MKKAFLLIVTLVISLALSSYRNADNSNDYIYYTSVTAWSSATDSEIYYIYYKEGNGVRKYYSSCGDTSSMTCLLFVKENELYKSEECRDYRRNYKYRTYHSAYYFNCNKGLPYMVDEDRVRR